MKFKSAIQTVGTCLAIVVLGCALGAVSLVALGYAAFWTSLAGMCGSKHVSTNYSPDRRWQVNTDVADCGAMTDFATQISIRPGPDARILDRWHGKTMVVVSDSNHGKATQYNDAQGTLANTRWINASHLLVIGSDGSRAFVKTTEVGTVKITYQVPHGEILH